MIDLHTHTFFSDGTMVPPELIQRAESKGLRGVALTDHADPPRTPCSRMKAHMAARDGSRFHPNADDVARLAR
jgi:histidinol phosphatase-like PHP family hydrolase